MVPKREAGRHRFGDVKGLMACIPIGCGVGLLALRKFFVGWKKRLGDLRKNMN